MKQNTQENTKNKAYQHMGSCVSTPHEPEPKGSSSKKKAHHHADTYAEGSRNAAREDTDAARAMDVGNAAQDVQSVGDTSALSGYGGRDDDDDDGMDSSPSEVVRQLQMCAKIIRDRPPGSFVPRRVLRAIKELCDVCDLKVSRKGSNVTGGNRRVANPVQRSNLVMSSPGNSNAVDDFDDGESDSSRKSSVATLSDIYRMGQGAGAGAQASPSGVARKRSFNSLPSLVQSKGHSGSMVFNSDGSQRARLTEHLPNDNDITDNVTERVILAAAEVVNSALEPLPFLIWKIASNAVQLTFAEKATVFLHRESERELVTYISNRTGYSSDMTTNPSTGAVEDYTEVVVSMTEEAASLEVVAADTGKLQLQRLDEAREEHSEMYMPVRSASGSVVAVIKVVDAFDLNANPRDFNAEDEASLGAFSFFCGACLVMGTLHRDLDHSATRLRSLLMIAKKLSDDVLSTELLSAHIIEAAQDVLKADRCALYLMGRDEESGAPELVATVRTPNGDTQRVSVPLGNGVAGVVAKTGAALNIPDAYKDRRFNPAAEDAMTGYKTTSILCIPVKYADEIVAVAQLVNKTCTDEFTGKKSVIPFTKTDVDVFYNFAVFAGVNLRNAMMHERMLHEKRKQNAILDVIQQLNGADITRTQDIIWRVMNSAKQLGSADRCALFLVDKETNELYTTVADNTGKEIRIPKTAGVAGWVASNGTALNIRNAYEDPRFNTEVDKATGYHTQTILCMPVQNEGEVIAVTQLVNKRGGVFTKEDEEVLAVFSAFAAMTLRNVQMFEFMKKAEEDTFKLLTASQNASGRALNANRRASSHQRRTESTTEIRELIKTRSTLTQDEINKGLTPHFPVHNYNLDNAKQNRRLIPILVELMDQMGFIDDFSIDERVLYNFLWTVRKKYRAVPYHNFTHAFDVTQTLMTFISEGKLVPTYLKPVDAFVLVVCGICHDIDHMGMNNSFHFKAETPLAVLTTTTGSRSVLEIHHCNLAVEILGEAENNVFENLPDNETKEVWKTLINAILATDMARHGEVCADWEQMMADGFNIENKENVRQMVAFLLKCADISNITKPFEISKRWGQYVTAEFSWQGADEPATTKNQQQAQNTTDGEANSSETTSPTKPQYNANRMKADTELDVSPMFERQSELDLAKGQVQFMENVGLSMYRLLKHHVPSLGFVTDQLETNLKQWKSIVEQLS